MIEECYSITSLSGIWYFRCYDCDDQVLVQAESTIHNCIKLILKAMNLSPPPGIPVLTSNLNDNKLLLGITSVLICHMQAISTFNPCIWTVFSVIVITLIFISIIIIMFLPSCRRKLGGHLVIFSIPHHNLHYGNWIQSMGGLLVMLIESGTYQITCNPGHLQNLSSLFFVLCIRTGAGTCLKFKQTCRGHYTTER